MTWFALGLGAALLVSSTTLLEKKALHDGRSLEVVFVLALFNAALSIPLSFFADFSGITGPVLGMIFVATIFGTGALYMSARSLKHAQVSETAPFFAFAPLLVSLLAFLFLGEALSMEHLFGMVLVVGGLIFLEMKNLKGGIGLFQKGRERYLWTIVIAVFLYSISTIFDRVILAHYDVSPLAFLVIIHGLLAVNFALIFAVAPLPKEEFNLSFSKTWRILLLIAVLSFLQRYLFVNAIALAASIGLVVAVKRLSILFTVIIGGKLFHEEGVSRKIWATCIVLAGTLLLI